MATQTSLVAQQVRIRQWAEQIRNCQNRPKGMDVETWCTQNNLTKDQLLLPSPACQADMPGSDAGHRNHCFCGTARTCTRSKENRYSKRIRYMHFGRNSANDPY